MRAFWEKGASRAIPSPSDTKTAIRDRSAIVIWASLVAGSPKATPRAETPRLAGC